MKLIRFQNQSCHIPNNLRFECYFHKLSSDSKVFLFWLHDRLNNRSALTTVEFLLFIYFLIYLWLCWVFVSVRGLSLVAASGDHSSSRCAGLSPSRPVLLRSTSSRRTGSAAVGHGPSFSVACGIFPDQGSNPCPLHWQADSQPLRHQGSPRIFTFFKGHYMKAWFSTSNSLSIHAFL